MPLAEAPGRPAPPLAGAAAAPRRPMLPYGRQSIDDEDVAAVVDALRSDWLTTGPRVGEFERGLAAVTGTREAVAVNSGTAALHAAVHALGVGPGDEVIVPALTFAASANCVLYCGGTPVFADVDPDTLLLDPASVEARRTPRTRAVVGVDYAGQPCDWPALRALADVHDLRLVADASHAIGGALDGRRVGTLADCTTFSFHPVKQLTTGEGGAVVTDDAALATRMRRFRNHGITTDHAQREAQGAWYYEMEELGYNYRLTDLQCALGTSQLRRLAGWLERLARRYDAALAGMAGVRPLATRAGVTHAYHLYVVRLGDAAAPVDRDAVFAAMRAQGIGVNVHYVPVHLHPYYRRALGTGPGLCPTAEREFTRLLTLPLFPAMQPADVDRVVDALGAALAGARR